MANSTMANKKHHKRKYAAIVLGLVGVAGLSVASAASLNVTATNEVAIGTAEFIQCDPDGVNVEYDYAAVGSGFEITNLEVSDINEACIDQDILVTLDYADGTEAAGGSDVVKADTFTVDLTDKHINIEKDLGDVTVVIG